MSVDLNEIEQAEVNPEERLVEQATSGVPELVPVSLFRDHMDNVEDLGYVPRMWGNGKQ